MNKIFDKANLIKIVLILYTLSIILDLHIFYNSISTLIRVGIITIIFSIIFIKYANNKERKFFLVYFVFLFVYSIAHFINSTNFTNKIPTIYSNLDEALYIYKMIMNIFIIYIVYKLGINLKQFMKYMKISLWFICGSIVLCNLFKLGYRTYDFNLLNYNIFDWFNNDFDYREISGKGYFHLANQIVAIVLLYFPLLLNEIKEKFKLTDILLSLFVLLSMLVIGNRLSSVGPLIILVVALLIYLLLIIIKKEVFKIKYFLYIIISMVIYNILLFNSPLLSRENYYHNLKNNNEISTNIDKKIKANNNKTDIENIFNEKKVNLNFPLKYYPYENDQAFWDNMLTKNSGILIDSRYLEISISQRLKDLNDNKIADDYLGIGYNRIINVVNIERDYTMQYYSIGIMGTVLLLGIYFITYIYALIKILINLEVKFNYKNMMLAMGIGIFLVAAYYSGNLLNAISAIIPLSFALAILLNEVRKKKNIDKKILGFKICDLSQEEILKNLSKDIKNNTSNIIFNINPLIITNFYKNKKIVDEFNQEKYQIPDGIGVILASKMKDGELKRRITGVGFFEKLCKLSIKEKQTIFLYGGKDGVAKKAKENLEKRYSNIQIVETINGYVEEKVALKKILKTKPDILFVALGSPKQENFIIDYKNKLKNIKIIMPVGGTFDIISGNIKRAPKIITELNLEWFYRMIKEPKRIKVNIKIFHFIFLVIFKNNCYNNKS